MARRKVFDDAVVRAVLVWACCLRGGCLVACADVLGVPEHPYLMQPPSASQREGSPASERSNGSPEGLPRDEAASRPPSELDSEPARQTEQPAAVGIVGGAVLGETAADAGLLSPADRGTEASEDALDAGAGAADPLRACGTSESRGPNGDCYLVIPDLLSGADARARCRSHGAGWDLAAIHDLESNTFIVTLISEEAWLGGSDASEEGSWRWLRDDELFWRGDQSGGPDNGAFAAWNSDEPNGGDSSDCMRLNPRTARWADLECEELRRGVCEGPAL